ncbi:MAG: beta-galactosidase GalB [Anaerolineae bacterium]
MAGKMSSIEQLGRPVARAEDFNFGWRFLLGDPADAQRPEFDDGDWRELRLPHDWSVEFPFDPVDGEGATGYLPGGIGWYRKRFTLRHDEDQLVFIVFDGVYNRSRVWCNGELLGENPYGYSPFWFDLTPHLRPSEEEQVIAVRVDHSRYVDSRWYTGSGIYRDVKLVTKSRLHIPIWGVRLTTPEVSAEEALVRLEIRLRNDFAQPKGGVLRTMILDAEGREVAEAEEVFTLEPGEEGLYVQTVSIPTPELWHPDHPYLYRAVTLVQGDELYEVYETRFGVRTIAFDPERGFFLNGENMRIKGVCLHHDGGLVGAAVPIGVWRRRLAALKEAGCNAIRLAHNPSAEAFLDLCDEMGFLVQVEFFDEWDNPKDKRLNQHNRHKDWITESYSVHFSEWAESDLKRTMLRDRNHPCVFQWSIGNEIEWTYPRYSKASGYFDPGFEGSWFWSPPPYSFDEIRARFEALPEEEHVLARTAEKLVRWVREMDETRPVTANCVLPCVGYVSGYADLLDVVGYSYRRVMYDIGHASYPDKPIMGTENVGQWHEWKAVIERPFISGMFIWTGVDYLGESHDKWPQKSFPCGLLDLAGFPRPAYFLFKSLWQDEPVIHLRTQRLEKSPYRVDDQGAVIEREPGGWQRRLWVWHELNEHWNYEPGELVVVEVYSNCDEVELFLNGRSLGVQHLSEQEDRAFKWAVPFAEGILEARGRHADGRTVSGHLRTASEPAEIALEVDQTSLKADGYDVAHVVAQLVDASGVPVRHMEREIVFKVDGPCRVLGVDNGAHDNVQPFQSDRLTTSQGRALLIVQSLTSPGAVTIAAVSGPIGSSPVEIDVRP